MTSVGSDTTENETLIQPSAFYISGLSNVPHKKYYYIFLCFIYTVTVLGNSLIMTIIYLARTLHTAKYVAVFNLALSDLCGSSALIPKLLDMQLFEHQYIPYESCLANMFFVLHFMNLQSLSLLALAYDRLIAICFPLRYHAIVSKAGMTLIICVMWGFSVTLVALTVAFINRLSFCKSTIVDSYFCDHGPVYKLACNDKSLNILMAGICIASMLFIPFILISVSYLCIGLALCKISHGAERTKAMKTCTSHLILVAMFYLPIICVYMVAVSMYIHPNIRIINSALTQTIPPMLNPIIYTLKTEEVLQSVKTLFKQTRIHTGVERPRIPRILQRINCAFGVARWCSG